MSYNTASSKLDFLLRSSRVIYTGREHRILTDSHSLAFSNATRPAHQQRITTYVRQRRMLPTVGQFVRRCQHPEPTDAS